MKVEKDYEKLLKLFNKHRVKYCIIGAYAVAFYAKPRYTKDMDILVEPNIGNGKRIVNALNEFGFKSLNLSEKDFSRKGKIILTNGGQASTVLIASENEQCFNIDLISSVWSIDYKRAQQDMVVMEVEGIKIPVVSVDKLLEMKKDSFRPRDIADTYWLKKIKKG